LIDSVEPVKSDWNSLPELRVLLRLREARCQVLREEARTEQSRAEAQRAAHHRVALSFARAAGRASEDQQATGSAGSAHPTLQAEAPDTPTGLLYQNVP
jgi:hypothetical protein